MTAPRVDLFGGDAVFHHLGVAVRSIAASVAAGVDPVHDERQQVSVAFVELSGIRVELIEPATADSPITASLEHRQPLVHLCFEVSDLPAAIAAARASGFHKIASPVAARAFDNRRIAWVYSRIYGLVELLER